MVILLQDNSPRKNVYHNRRNRVAMMNQIKEISNDQELIKSKLDFDNVKKPWNIKATSYNYVMTSR